MKSQISKEQIQQINASMRNEINSKPPKIGLCGVSGVGKSSTANRMFRTSLPTSDTVACTSKFIEKDISLNLVNGHGAGIQTILRIEDAMGLGEDIRKDLEFLEGYKNNLPHVDVILYVSSARNRGVALDQQYLLELKEFAPKMVFGISQVDIVEPMNWNAKLNLPSKEQSENIEVICKDRASRFSAVLDREVKVIPYSSKTGYGIQKLFTELIMACPKERAWIFDGLKNFSYTDFIPQEALKQMKTNDA